MKVLQFALVFAISVCLYCDDLFAQIGLTPNCNRFTVYLDNLLVGNEQGIDTSRIPNVILQFHYKEHMDFSANNPLPQRIDHGYIKNVHIEIDTTFHKREVHIRTKKAKDGFLCVNNSIMNNCFKVENFKIVYVYNNTVVTTKKDVMRLLRLRKRCIHCLELDQNELSGIITVYINCFQINNTQQ